MRRSDPSTEQIGQKLATAVQKLPESVAECVMLFNQLGSSNDPRIVFFALPFIWDAKRPPPPVHVTRATSLWQVLKRLPEPKRWPDRDIPEELKNAALSAIRCIFSRLPTDIVPSFDEFIRSHGRQWAVVLGDQWIWITPPRPSEIAPGPARVHLLSLLSLHGDGRIREEAVIQLAAERGELLLPFLVWRCGDWVSQVRERAMTAVRWQLRFDFAEQFVLCLPLLRRLLGIQRIDLSKFVADIHRFLLSQPGLSALRDALKSSLRLVRRDACALISTAGVPDADILAAVMNDDDVIVRGWALLWEEQARSDNPQLATELRSKLSFDSAARIRARAIRTMIENGDPATVDRLRHALFDRAPSLRDIARFHLRKMGAFSDFAALYRERLRTPGRVSIPALAGLAETGTKTDADLFVPFLDGKPREARAALRGLAKLDADRFHQQVLERTADRRLGVSRDALRLLGRRVPAEDRESLENLWDGNLPPHARQTIVEAVLRLPPWVALVGLLNLASTSSGDAIVTSAFSRWRPEHRANYGPKTPTDSQRAQIQVGLDIAGGIIPHDARKQILIALSRA